MSSIDRLFAAMVTRNDGYSGSDSSIALVANSLGVDKVQYTFPDTAQSDQEQGQANLYNVDIFGNLDTNNILQTYFRVEIRGDDAWLPEHFFVWGEAPKEQSSIIPLAMVVDANTAGVVRQRDGVPVKETAGQAILSADNGEGDVSLALMPVYLGDSATPITRLLIIMTTADADDAGTDSTIRLQITRGENLIVDFVIPNTPQDEQERAQANFYLTEITNPFVKNSIDANNSIKLTIEGEDAWMPDSFFIFGLDTASGVPSIVVPLVYLPTWGLGIMSADTSEGHPSVILPVKLP